ncbi:ParB N-terminal domain-containing protein [Methylosinus sp. PW1]|uniref:ParB N-terminal domain-containing protein n=1 Tax=Methylosinus sp. PW1 TaxID=107636 RepID=UPI000690FDDA|nr:ParB N-terminal domain-containing protein [Methylosinus sp. PW1]
MNILIESAEQFKTMRGNLKTPTIKSRHGQVPVPATVTLLVARSLLKANNYNPNSVPDEKMKLLKMSILDNGFCFPVVTIWSDDDECFVIVDGFHRYMITGPKWLDMEFVPIVVLDHDVSKRMYATVQFNKARGTHQVDLDADLIRALIEQGKSEDEISDHLGIDLDTIHRYKQLTGIADLFKNSAWSPSWNAVEGIREENIHG